MARYRSRRPKKRYRKYIQTDQMVVTDAVASDTIFTVAEGEELTLVRTIFSVHYVKVTADSASRVSWDLQVPPGGTKLTPTLSNDWEVNEPKASRSVLINETLNIYGQYDGKFINYDIKTKRKMEEGDTILFESISSENGNGVISFKAVLIFEVK